MGSAIKRKEFKRMVFIERYSLKEIKKNQYKVISYEKPMCPYCGSSQMNIGTRHRLVRLSDGTSIDVIIRRLRCQNPHCQKINHELPDFLIPYYRYDKDTVMQAIKDSVEDHAPCEENTIKRWKDKFKK